MTKFKPTFSNDLGHRDPINNWRASKRPVVTKENTTQVIGFSTDRYEIKASQLNFDPDPMLWPVTIESRLGNGLHFRLQQKGPKGILYVQDGSSLELHVAKG